MFGTSPEKDCTYAWKLEVPVNKVKSVVRFDERYKYGTVFFELSEPISWFISVKRQKGSKFEKRLL